MGDAGDDRRPDGVHRASRPGALAAEGSRLRARARPARRDRSTSWPRGSVELVLEVDGDERLRGSGQTDWDAALALAAENTVVRTGDVLAGPAVGHADGIRPGAEAAAPCRPDRLARMHGGRAVNGAAVAWLTLAPVKGLALRAVTETMLDRTGARGDRLFHLIDEGGRLVNRKQAPLAGGRRSGELRRGAPDSSLSRRQRARRPGRGRREGHDLVLRQAGRRPSRRGPFAAGLSDWTGKAVRLVRVAAGAAHDRGPAACRLAPLASPRSSGSRTPQASRTPSIRDDSGC